MTRHAPAETDKGTAAASGCFSSLLLLLLQSSVAMKREQLHLSVALPLSMRSTMGGGGDDGG